MFNAPLSLHVCDPAINYLFFHVQVSNTDADATEVFLIVYAVCVTIIVLVLVLLVSGLLCKRLVNCLYSCS